MRPVTGFWSPGLHRFRITIYYPILDPALCRSLDLSIGIKIINPFLNLEFIRFRNYPRKSKVNTEKGQGRIRRIANK
jgi:hypothetical protein